MRLYKRGSVYWFELVFNGHRIQRSTRSANRRAADEIASAFRTALAKGEVGITERKRLPLFPDAMTDFLAWSALEHRSHPSTAERYRYSSAALLRFFKRVPLDKITPAEVEAFKEHRSEMKAKQSKAPVRPATINRELACLRAMFNHARKTHPLLQNPVSAVKFLEEDNLQERVLTFAEQRQYLAVATLALRDVATLILETGMRPEEVYTLKDTSVNLEKGYLRVYRGKTKAAKRRIDLTPAAHHVLAQRLRTGYLFPCNRDAERPIASLQGAHARALKDSGVAQFRLYDLRHTFATRAAEAGIDPVTLAAMLGHSRIQMVLRYAHPTQQHQSTAMKQLSDHNAAREAQEQAQERRKASGLKLVSL